MTDVATSVSIWFETYRVGTLDVGREFSLEFRYADNWLASEYAFPLSATMPLDQQVYPGTVIAPWLANLLPEEGQLRVLSSNLRISGDDIVGLLLQIGRDTAGALSIGSPTDANGREYTPITEFYGEADLGTALEMHLGDIAIRPFLAGEEGVGTSLAGGQGKSALAVLDADGRPVLRLPSHGDQIAIPRNGAPSTFILKPENPILPGIAENEAWCMVMAQAIGIEAAEVSVMPANGCTALAALRYDRKAGQTMPVIRVHQEDFAQANGLSPSQKYERGPLPGLSLRDLLGTARHLEPGDTLALLDQWIFSILIADSDAHAKNYSILCPVGGAPRLAPLYDASTSLIWERVEQRFAQKIAGKARRADQIAGRHWDFVAGEIGANPAEIKRRVRELAGAILRRRDEVTERVCAMPGARSRHVEETAVAIGHNVQRVVGKL